MCHQGQFFPSLNFGLEAASKEIYTCELNEQKKKPKKNFRSIQTKWRHLLLHFQLIRQRSTTKGKIANNLLCPSMASTSSANRLRCSWPINSDEDDVSIR